MFSFQKATTLTVITLTLALFAVTPTQAQTTEADVTIIELVQTPGEFGTEELNLRPGKYQFRIVNQTVDHEVGFVIQAEKDIEGDLMETALPNSFTSSTVKTGEVAYTGVVDLTKGKYVYSCPLNPTPHYRIKVK